MPDSQIKAPDFERSMARLDEIVRSLELGSLPLAESLKLYEEGVSLINSCEKLLENAEMKIKLLQRTADGMAEKDISPGDDRRTTE